MTGPWAHPPRKQPFLARHGWKFIAALCVMLTVMVATGVARVGIRAIEQAAIVAVEYEETMK